MNAPIYEFTEKMNTQSCILCGFIRNEKLSFMRFPKQESRRKCWLAKCNLPEESDVSTSRLCSRHFVPEDFYETPTKRRLHNTAIPTVFCESKSSSSSSLLLSRKEVEDKGEGPNRSTIRSSHYCVVCHCRKAVTSRLPRDKLEREKWMKHFSIEPKSNLNNIRICEEHFKYVDCRNERGHPHNRKSIVLLDDGVQDTTRDCVNETTNASSGNVMDLSMEIVMTNDVSPYNILEPEIVIESEKLLEAVTLEKENAAMPGTPTGVLSGESTKEKHTEEVTKNYRSIGVQTCSQEGLRDDLVRAMPLENENSATPTTPTGVTSRESMTKRHCIFPRYPQDISTPHIATPRRAKHALQLTKDCIAVQRDKIKILQQQNRRFQKKIKNLQEMFAALCEENKLTEDQKEILMVLVYDDE